MRRHWQYLKYVLRHKWFVLLAGLKIGVPILILIFHDWDKFLPDEWFPYARFFYNSDGTSVIRRDKTGYYKPTDTGNQAFENAWVLHARRNKHHWQYWAMPKEDGIKCYPMPEVYILEMIADWKGAGRAQGTPDTLDWYIDNYYKIKLHEATRLVVERQLLGNDVGLLTMGAEAQSENCSVQDWREFWHYIADTTLDLRRSGFSYSQWKSFMDENE